MDTLEGLLFKATNPVNKLEDVNTIKQFCDAVNSNLGGDAPAVACRLLAHKIQSPQEREAIQALAVIEACVKSCGPVFHAEVGKFKFLNEMIKLVSPKYLGPRTPEHIKKKTIELLYLWSTKELKGETKIAEAYDMLKKQGIVTEDPVHVGDAVFASALPPRKSAPLNEEQTQKLRKLLQSKNPDDLQAANKIIKGMVHEDERKMDVLTKRATELNMVNNNAKLLGEMLDHYDKNNCGSEERQLLHELFQSCEKMQPKLFRLAADTEEDDESSLGKILQASDDISRVIDRYKMVIVQGKPDILKKTGSASGGGGAISGSDQLLDLDVATPPASANPDSASGARGAASIIDDDLLGLVTSTTTAASAEVQNNSETKESPSKTTTTTVTDEPAQPPSIDDLLNGSPTSKIPTATMPVTKINDVNKESPDLNSNPHRSKMEAERASRQRGLEELDFLGESVLKQHLPGKKSPQFAKKQKESLSTLQQKQKEKDLTSTSVPASNVKSSPNQNSPPQPTSTSRQTEEAAGSGDKNDDDQLVSAIDDIKISTNNFEAAAPASTANGQAEAKEVKLADLEVPLSSIKPGAVKPLTLQESEDGVSIVLHFGKDQPRDHVSAIVVTVINRLSEAISGYELKAVVPKGCKIKLQPPTTTSLPAHNPFVPPSAITQVMLIANPHGVDPVSLKYIVSYTTPDGETQTEMGQVAKLPI